MADYAISDVRFDLFAVKVFRTSVSSSEVVKQRTNFNPLSTLPRTLLHEGSEGSSSSSETSHDDGLCVSRRKLHDRRLDARHDFCAYRQAGEVSRALSEPLYSSGSVLVHRNDEEMNAISHGILRTRNGIMTRFDARYFTEDILNPEIRLCARESLEDICVSDGI